MRMRHGCQMPGARRHTTLATCVALWLTLLASALAPVSGHALADGGAPNMAYAVGAGTAHGDLVAIDIAQRRLLWRLGVGGGPRAVLLSVDGRFAYIALAAANDLAIVDTSARQIAGTIPMGHAPSALAIDSTAT